MTLRTRLVLALVALATVGLAVFGVVTSSLYERSLSSQLDQDLRGTARGRGAQLLSMADQSTIDPETCAPVGADPSTLPVPAPGFGPGAPPGGTSDTYSELRDATGAVVACTLPLTTNARPDLPASVALGADGRALFDVGSAVGSGTWRVLAISRDQVARPGPSPSTPSADPGVVLVAVRTDGIESSLARLLRIEVAAALGLLSALAVGAWLVLRRGLRPLEEMAASAATITAGDLSERVEPADDHTEVGQLGLALNTMLDGIEDSFRERDATEARLRQFLADASHELRTPLTSIQGYAELFRLAARGGPEELERLDLPVVLQRIEQESNRMEALVEDLLLLARLDEPRSLEPVPVDLSLVAAEACSSTAALHPDTPITFDAPAPVVVHGVSDHLHRAIVNLVNNAVSHTPPGTAVEVTVAANGVTRLASVTVRDHGPGLTPDALVHVFDRFWQADPARVGAGSGLGLSIVAGIAAEHGGRAVAANAHDGGAAFTIEVPSISPAG